MENISTFSYPSWSITPAMNLMGELVIGAGGLASLIYCLYIARRNKVVWPLWMYVGAGVTTLFECFCNLFEHIAYPMGGARIILDGWLGRSIPLYCFFIYLCYFAGPGAWLYQRIINGISTRDLTKIIVVTVIACATFEPMIVHFRFWYYYGVHPFNWTGLPMHWWFSNALSVMIVPVACALVRKHILTSDRQTWVFAPLMIMAIWAGKSVDIPLFFTFYATTDIFWLSVASLATIAFSIMGFYGIVRAVAIVESGSQISPQFSRKTGPGVKVA